MIYIVERELALYICSTTHFINWLLTRAFLIGPCHCSYIFVPCLAFRVRVSGDLNQNIPFVAGVLSTFLHSRFTRSHPLEPKLPSAIKYFFQFFLRRFRDPIRVPRISNRVPRIRENYHRVPKIRENRVPTDPYRVPNIFLKKNPDDIIHIRLNVFFEAVDLHKTMDLNPHTMGSSHSTLILNEP